jgi:hypothetical protein
VKIETKFNIDDVVVYKSKKFGSDNEKYRGVAIIESIICGDVIEYRGLRLQESEIMGRIKMDLVL